MPFSLRSAVHVDVVRPALCCVIALAVSASAAQSQVNILTNRYDPQRTGANLAETTLTSLNVTASRFGKLYSLPVDGAVFAQPLYVSGLTIAGALRNVVYAATMNDKVYAFDADSPSPTALWVRDFTSPPGVTAVPITDIVPANLNIIGNVGVQSTPVIDLPSATLYLVARTKESDRYVQRLHALDLATGEERPGSPVVIGGSVSGMAPDATVGSTGSIITFDPKVQVQRAGLALANGVVLVAWGAHEDVTPSHGWIMGFDAATLARVGIFAITPDGYLGGVWQGGRAPVIDADGNAYFATGNGPWDGARNFGDSLLKFSVTPTAMALIDYFTPSNEAALYSGDDDLSGSGFTMLPDSTLLLGGGKEGVLYLIDSRNLGHQAVNDAQVLQKMPVSGGHVMGGVVYWRSPAAGPLAYNWSEDDVLKAYQLTGSHVTTSPYLRGLPVSPGHPGGSLTVSAAGSAATTGVVWASMPSVEDALHGLTAGILRAFDADTLQEIWNSEQNAARDRVGTLMKFVPPVVANGKVFLPNYDNAIAVYGLLPADFTISASPASRSVATAGSTTFAIAVMPQGDFGARVDLAASGQPAGTTIAFSPPYVIGAGTATATITVAASADVGTFSLAVSGSDGIRVRSTDPLPVTVRPVDAGQGRIGISFVGTAASIGSTDTAGVVEQSGWNNAVGAARSTPLQLADETGTNSGATVTWSANGTWRTPITALSGNQRLMAGYLDTSSTSVTTVTVAGLLPRAYDVYVYVDGDNTAYARSATIAISGPDVVPAATTVTDALRTNFSGVFAEAHASAGNYVRFTITGSGFTIAATPGPASSATRRAPLNAIQIVPATVAVPRAISVDFGDGSWSLAATAVAGITPRSHWNTAAGARRTTPLALVDETGAPTTATATWAAGSTWTLPIAPDTADRAMMRSYLDTTNTSVTTISIAGLPLATYDVLVYADGDNRLFSRTAAYTISGSGITTATAMLTDAASVNFTAPFVDASGGSGNYVRFRITGRDFLITATPTAGTSSTRRAPVNAIQVIPVAGG